MATSGCHSFQHHFPPVTLLYKPPYYDICPTNRCIFFDWLVQINLVFSLSAPPDQSHPELYYIMLSLPRRNTPVHPPPALSIPSHSELPPLQAAHLGFGDSVAPRKPGHILLCRGFPWVLHTVPVTRILISQVPNVCRHHMWNPFLYPHVLSFMDKV